MSHSSNPNPNRGRGRSRGRDKHTSSTSGHGGGSQRPGSTSSSRGGSRGRGPHQPAAIFGEGEQDIDARLESRDLNNLLKSFGKLKLKASDTPARQDWGTLGQHVKLYTNCFAMEAPKGSILEYEAKITPSLETKRKLRKRVFELLEEVPQFKQVRDHVAHDFGSRIFSVGRLPDFPQPFQIRYYHEDAEGPNENSKVYELEIVFERELHMETLNSYVQGNPKAEIKNLDLAPYLSALNIMISHYPSHNGVAVGRNRFFFPQGRGPLGGALEACSGFYSSVRPAFNQLLVNVNVSTTAFYVPGRLSEKLDEWREFTKGLSFNVFLKGLRVRLVYLNPPVTKTVKRLSRQSASQVTFLFEEAGRNVTVEQYFRLKHNITLRRPDLLIEVDGQRSIFIPAELCEVLERQPFRGKLSDKHTEQMIKFACRPPSENAQNIVTNGLKLLGFEDSLPPLKFFKIDIDDEMSVVPARVLPTPRLQYGSSDSQVVSGGAWNLKKANFFKGSQLNNWAVLVIKDGGRANDFNSVKKAVDAFVGVCRGLGIDIPTAPQYVEVDLRRHQNDPTRSAAKTSLSEKIRSIKPIPKLLLVLLANSDSQVYSSLKQLCDVELDVHTVCVLSYMFMRGHPQYFANVALKVNMKLGGVNHVLDSNSVSSKWLKEKPTMIVGMDVTHPGPGSAKYSPSIAAVVASVDQYFAQYPASLRIQKSKQEEFTDLDKMMVERLVAFQTKSGRLPERILIYRDGVSEGQYKNTVVDKELPQIIKSFTAFNAGRYSPQLTIVVCGKRHHIRFYPTDRAGADDKGNPLPGTVVDQGVTAIYEHDFYLQAHSGLQGTTRPTHYFVAHDGIRFSTDLLQRLTNDVSYLFARATRSVSLVSPAYYADLACWRGRCYIQQLLTGGDDASTVASGTASEDSVLRQAERIWKDGVGKNLRETMFYL